MRTPATRRSGVSPFRGCPYEFLHAAQTFQKFGLLSVRVGVGKRDEFAEIGVVNVKDYGRWQTRVCDTKF